MALSDPGKLTSAVDYTSSGRALGTTYTAGKRRRLVVAALRFATATAASATYSTTIAGKAMSALPIAAFSATETLGTLTASVTIPVTFMVDPGGSYSINVTAGTIAVASWVEVDL